MKLILALVRVLTSGSFIFYCTFYGKNRFQDILVLQWCTYKHKRKSQSDESNLVKEDRKYVVQDRYQYEPRFTLNSPRFVPSSPRFTPNLPHQPRYFKQSTGATITCFLLKAKHIEDSSKHHRLFFSCSPK